MQGDHSSMDILKPKPRGSKWHTAQTIRVAESFYAIAAHTARSVTLQQAHDVTLTL